MKAKLLLLIALSLSALSAAQEVDKQKVERFATAVAHAEGFGVRHAIPTRYHNPGDLKSRRDLAKLPGQKYLGKGEHVVFASDQAGWNALQDYIIKMVDGRSRRFNPNMTITQVARIYAGNWRPWVKIVTRELEVPANTRLRDLLLVQEIVPPTIAITPLEIPDLQISALMPTLEQDTTVGVCNDVHMQNCR
jgi:hypothetical protein